MNKISKGLVVIAILLTVITLAVSVTTIKRWQEISKKETVINELREEYNRLAEDKEELFFKLQELRK